jgi:hypothetical protein
MENDMSKVRSTVYQATEITRKTWLHPDQTWTDLEFFDEDGELVTSVTIHHTHQAQHDLFTSDAVIEECGK